MQNDAVEHTAYLKWIIETFRPFTRNSIMGPTVEVDKLITWLAEIYGETDKSIYRDNYPQIRSAIGEKLNELKEILVPPTTTNDKA